MKQHFRFFLILFTLAVFSFSLSIAESLSRDEQKRIIESYLYATGKLKERPVSMAQSDVTEGDHVYDKCGMSAAADFALNRGKFDTDLLRSFGLSPDSLSARPTGLPSTLTSTSGRFKVHYTTTGTDAVYQPNVDASPANGVPDFVDAVGRILDSVYSHTIVTLSYPIPPSDGFYAAGIDSAFDVYLHDLGGSYYGLSYIDSLFIDGPGTLRATSFMELDNDYQQIPQYASRPLDAVRVTAAHEYFHSVQFGIDVTEAEDYNTSQPKRYWMEMSAVWMEEEIYDNINDYYFYIPIFFNRPGRSIQQFSSFVDLHPYASAVFPIFLSELFGPNVIKAIWSRCGTLGAGASFLDASEAIFDSILTSPDIDKTFPLVFRQFTLWNYFTGTRAGLLPGGIQGYSEAAAYPLIPSDSMVHIIDSVFIFADENRRNPDHNAATYIVWESPKCVTTDTVILYGRCVPSADSCFDTLFVPVTQQHDFELTDTFLTLILGLDPTYEDLWGMMTIFELEGFTDSLEIAFTVLAGDQAQYLFIPHQEQYKSITFILSPSSIDENYYAVGEPIELGIIADETIDTITLCPPPPPSGPPDLSLAKLISYPNPAVVPEMDAESIGFAVKHVVSGTLLFEVDIFSEAGEYLKTVSSSSDAIDSTYIVSWDLKSEKGSAVSSGVYLIYGRLYNGIERGPVLFEERSKLLIVR